MRSLVRTGAGVAPLIVKEYSSDRAAAESAPG
jgi:hypothetical protein